MTPLKRRTRKTVIAIVGGCVLIIGIIAIPYPGPGWLIVFAGLGILATEFTWARRILDYAKEKYDLWQEWLGRQKAWLKATVWCLTALIVIVTIWLLNGYGIINSVLHLHQDWVQSPILG